MIGQLCTKEQEIMLCALSYLYAGIALSWKIALQVIACFHATWCGPCRMIYPCFEELSAQYMGVTFLKVDVDAVEVTAQLRKLSLLPVT